MPTFTYTECSIAIVTVLAFFIDYRYPKEGVPAKLNADSRTILVWHIPLVFVGLNPGFNARRQGIWTVIEYGHVAGTSRLKVASICYRYSRSLVRPVHQSATGLIDVKLDRSKSSRRTPLIM